MTFTATRGGVFSTYQRLFRIQDATVTFDPRQGIVPNLDLHATAHVDNPDPDPARNAIGSADITVSVTGPADAYTISYSSDPPLLASADRRAAGRPADPGVAEFRLEPAGRNAARRAGRIRCLATARRHPYRTGVTPIQQEAFSLFNTQLTQRLLSPLENAFGGAVGLTDLELTLDYGGRVGVRARQQLSRKHAVYATLGQVVSYPTRTQLGFASSPDPATTISFTYFQQNGTPYFTNSIFGNTNTVEVRQRRPAALRPARLQPWSLRPGRTPLMHKAISEDRSKLRAREPGTFRARWFPRGALARALIIARRDRSLLDWFGRAPRTGLALLALFGLLMPAAVGAPTLSVRRAAPRRRRLRRPRPPAPNVVDVSVTGNTHVAVRA